MDVRVPRVLTLAAGALLLAPAGAQAHSLVRPSGTTLAYLSADATSLNVLTVRRVGSELVLRDPRVDGGMDPGACDPGDVTTDRFSYIIEARCPARRVQRLRIDLGEREDRADVRAAVPTALAGGAGADTLRSGPAADVVDGGQGRDTVDGGAGPDEVVGGDGPDALAGGEGDDLVQARDGVRDQVACGPGADRADVDQLDAVAPDCEVVTVLATAPPPFGADGTDVRAPRLDVAASPVQRVGRNRSVRLRVTSTERGTVAASGGVFMGDLALPVETARQSVDAPGGGAELTIRLTGQAWREVSRSLRRRRTVLVRVGVVATDLAGNSRELRPAAIRLRR